MSKISPTPKQRIQSLLAKRHVYLYAEDPKLVGSVTAALRDSKVSLLVLTELDGSETNFSRGSQIFLVDMQLKKVRPEAIIERLYYQNTAAAPDIALIAKTPMDENVKHLLKRYNLRGYVSRANLQKLLLSQLEIILDNSHPLRRHERIMTSFAVSYEIIGVQKQGTCVSISEGGMFIQAMTSMPDNAEVTIVFSLPNADKVYRKKGTLIYQTTSGFAVKFKSNISNIVAELREAS